MVVQNCERCDTQLVLESVRASIAETEALSRGVSAPNLRVSASNLKFATMNIERAFF